MVDGDYLDKRLQSFFYFGCFRPMSAKWLSVDIARNQDFLRQTLAANAEGKTVLGEGLRSLGLQPIPTHANFYCVPFENEKRAQNIFEALLRQGVIVRPLRAFGLPHCLRITIGTREQNIVLMEALQKALAH